MYKKIKELNIKPKIYSKYTAKELWVDNHRSKQMLNYHLNEDIDVSSNNKNYIEDTVKFIVNRFQLDKNKDIIDFGCGPGLYTNRLANYTNVTGIDFSKESLDYAVKTSKNLDVKYILEDYLKIELDKKYDLITMIMYDICALSKEQRKQLFIKFKNILKKDGYIYFDVLSHNAYNKKNEETYYEHLQLNGFWSENDYYAFVNTYKYDSEKIILDKYHIIEENRSYDIYNWLKYYTIEELKNELYEVGITIKEYYNNMTGEKYTENSDTIAIVAEI